MKIETFVDRELTAEKIRSIETFPKHTNGVSFACLRNRVMVLLDGEPSHDAERLKECALAHMDTALSTHPDFTVCNMHDSHSLPVMPSELCAFRELPRRENIWRNMALHAECIDAAEREEVLAVTYEEE